MTKKIILTLFLLISFFGGLNEGFADEIKLTIPTIPISQTRLPNIDMGDLGNNINIPETQMNTSGDYIFKDISVDENGVETLEVTGNSADTILNSEEGIANIKEAMSELDKNSNDYKEYQAELSVEQEHLNTLKSAEAEAARDEYKKECEGAKNCLDQSSYTINTSLFSPIGKMTDKSGTVLKNTEQKINFLLGTIIQKLMIALGVLSVLIMTVGGGYIIMYHGQDDILSKGKSIFMSGIIALVVALSSYYLVSGLRFILYN